MSTTVIIGGSGKGRCDCGGWSQEDRLVHLGQADVGRVWKNMMVLLCSSEDTLVEIT